MTEIDESYNRKVLISAINKYLDAATSFTEESLNLLYANHDHVVWDLATAIYRQSGHKVEFSLVRDVVNCRIETIKYQIAEEKKRLIAEEARRAEEEARRAAERKRIDGEESLRRAAEEAEVFARVRRVISDQLEVEESEVSLESHLSYDLRADGDDINELVMAIEEEFDIEISDDESETDLDLELKVFGDPFWGSHSVSFELKAGKKPIVKNFVELICTKILS